TLSAACRSSLEGSEVLFPRICRATSRSPTCREGESPPAKPIPRTVLTFACWSRQRTVRSAFVTPTPALMSSRPRWPRRLRGASSSLSAAKTNKGGGSAPLAPSRRDIAMIKKPFHGAPQSLLDRGLWQAQSVYRLGGIEL